MPGGHIPASLYNEGIGVALKFPVIIRQTLLSSTSTFDAWADLSHTAAQYSAVEKHNANADCLSSRVCTPTGIGKVLYKVHSG